MKAAEVRQFGKSKLQATLNSLAKKQFKLKMELGSGSLPGNHQISQVRRDIARVKTIMTEFDNKKGGE